MTKIGVPSLLAALVFSAAVSGQQKGVPHQVVRVTEPNIATAVEVSVAINPTDPDHIVGVSQQGPTNFAYVSRDAGKTWKTVKLANTDKRTQGDDAVVFSPDGLAFRSYISFIGIRSARPIRAANGIFIARSRDGVTWDDSVAVVDHFNSVQPFEDKPWIRVDTNKESPHKGNLYVAWTKFDEYGKKNPELKSRIYFSRSKDNAKTFAPPFCISEHSGDCIDSGNTVMGAIPSVGSKGEVYVIWGGPKGISFVKSTDGGNKFGNEKILTETPGTWEFSVKDIMRCNGLPTMSVDLSAGPNRGSIYVCWVDLRNGDPDVIVIHSRDAGATWSAPTRVNDDPKGNKREQFFSSMAVDPADGSVNVLFYDRRNGDGTKTGLTMARSIDGGKTFANHKIDQPLFECNAKSFFGDYLGIDARGGRVVAMYMHFTGPKTLGLSAAVFNFKAGTQETQIEKR